MTLGRSLDVQDVVARLQKGNFGYQIRHPLWPLGQILGSGLGVEVDLEIGVGVFVRHWERFVLARVGGLDAEFDWG